MPSFYLVGPDRKRHYLRAHNREQALRESQPIMKKMPMQPFELMGCYGEEDHRLEALDYYSKGEGDM